MTTAVLILLVNAMIGAIDTLWYHEWRAKLPSRLDVTRTELRLHATRDCCYVFVYGGLGLGIPTGRLADMMLLLLACEIAVTLTDFIVEDRDRPALGGIAPGERILHSVMAITYGAALAHLLPALIDARREPTGLALNAVGEWKSVAMLLATTGIALTGARDLSALRGHDPVRWLSGRALKFQPSTNARR